MQNANEIMTDVAYVKINSTELNARVEYIIMIMITI